MFRAWWCFLVGVFVAVSAATGCHAPAQPMAAAARVAVEAFGEGAPESPADVDSDDTRGTLGGESESEEQPEDPEDGQPVIEDAHHVAAPSRSIVFGGARASGGTNGISVSVYRPPWGRTRAS